MSPEDRLKEFLLDAGMVSSAVLKNAETQAKKTGKTIEEVLLSNNDVSEDGLRRVKAWATGIPFVDLSHEKISMDVLSLIPEPIARNHNLVAYRKTPAGLEVAMLDVGDLPAIEFIKKKVGLRVLPRLTSTESIKNVLLQYRKSLQGEFDDIIKKESIHLEKINDDVSDNQSEEDLKKLAEDLPVVKIVDTLLSHAILQGASDIHIEPHEKGVVVRYRIDGILRDAMELPKTAGSGLSARIKVLSNLKLDEKRLPQDGRFKIDLNNEKVSFRVSILPTYYGEKIVMRLLRESVSGFTLEGLGFHGQGLESIHRALKHKTGMILATGPTGSGKSTTLYTLLDILNTPDVNISTVEDPIEYQMPRINQSQVRADIGFTFANGLRSLLRQDPDILMVGEIRDTETASLATNAALTGHLVLSTLHTNSSAGSVPRLIDMGIEPFLLVSTLDVVIGQRLVRKLGEEKEQYFLNKDEVAMLGKEIDLDRMMQFLKQENVVDANATWEKVPFYRPTSGHEEDAFKGRMGIHEVLPITPAIKNLIIQGATGDDIEEQAKKDGMMTLLEDGIFLAIQGMTTKEEVLRVVSE
ncbi:MAG: GspE/PulE family protein [Candidatus Pacebacteria bacterium]|nr:GspE/PulE family protein [Candidatus Paceibacterota bacterium]